MLTLWSSVDPEEEGPSNYLSELQESLLGPAEERIQMRKSQPVQVPLTEAELDTLSKEMQQALKNTLRELPRLKGFLIAIQRIRIQYRPGTETSTFEGKMERTPNASFKVKLEIVGKQMQVSEQ